MASLKNTLVTQESLNVEGYPVAPAPLQLEQVHIFVRHGERTPLKARMKDPPASLPEHWQMCSAVKQFNKAVHLTVPSVSAPRAVWFSKEVETQDASSARRVCLFGELTDLGRESTLNFGQALRKLYVDKLGFLPSRLQHEGQTHFRSTYVDRTIESLEQIIKGLYPPTWRQENIVPLMLIRNKLDDDLVSNTLGCPKLRVLEEQFMEAAAVTWNHRLKALDNKLSRYINSNPVRVDGHPRACGILDTVRSADAHGIPVPSEFFELEVVNLLESAISDEWFSIKSEEGRRLGMGRLLADISDKMEKKVQQGEGDPLKILLHSTHDSTLAALCATLDVFDDKWPAFTSSVTFELFSKKDLQGSKWTLQALLGEQWKAHTSSDDYYVRMRYQNKTMVLPICAGKGNHLAGHPELCTLRAFQQRVKELTPFDWEAECRLEVPR